ncbi:MAG: hypothetical protein IKO73_10115 [Bacteroidaceae bacterium]|nr:hypothetical protein [Bacteroidaceae bacterium]
MIERLSAEQIQQKQGFSEQARHLVKMVKVKMVIFDFGMRLFAHYI